MPSGIMRSAVFLAASSMAGLPVRDRQRPCGESRTLRPRGPRFQARLAAASMHRVIAQERSWPAMGFVKTPQEIAAIERVLKNPRFVGAEMLTVDFLTRP